MITGMTRDAKCRITTILLGVMKGVIWMMIVRIRVVVGIRSEPMLIISAVKMVMRRVRRMQI